MKLGSFDLGDGRCLAHGAKIELPTEPIAVWLQHSELGHNRRELAGYATDFYITGSELHGDVTLTYPAPVAAGGFDLDQIDARHVDIDNVIEIHAARLRSVTVRPAPVTPGGTP